MVLDGTTQSMPYSLGFLHKAQVTELNNSRIIASLAYSNKQWVMPVDDWKVISGINYVNKSAIWVVVHLGVENILSLKYFEIEYDNLIELEKQITEQIHETGDTRQVHVRFRTRAGKEELDKLSYTEEYERAN